MRIDAKLFVENYVAGSSLARFLNMSIKPKTHQRKIVFLRDPVKRFWSAIKKQHSINDIEGGVEKALFELGNSDLKERWFSEKHFDLQVNNIKDCVIGDVIVLDRNFANNLEKALLKYDVPWIAGFNLQNALSKPMNATDNSRDAEAVTYIQGDPHIMGRLREFYAKDFAWWDDPCSKIAT